MDFTLDRLVREFMVEDLGLDAIDRRYTRFLSLGISGLRDMYYDNLGALIKEEVLDVNDDGTVTLPSDYIDYHAIGLVSNGEFLSLGLNSNMADVYKNNCGDRIGLTPEIDVETGDFYYINTNNRQEGIGGSYGSGGGRSSVGEYKVYRDRGYISLMNTSATQIVLRYKADIEAVDGDFKVHPYNVEPIKAWIWMKYVSKSRSHNLGQVQLAIQNYKVAKKKALNRHFSFNVYEFLQAWQTGQRSSPKF